MRNKPSQKDIVLKELRTNGRVSRNQCLKMYISRLGAIICSLRTEGMGIDAEWKDGDYVYTLKDKPKDIITYSVGGTIVGKKEIW